MGPDVDERHATRTRSERMSVETRSAVVSLPTAAVLVRAALRWASSDLSAVRSFALRAGVPVHLVLAGRSGLRVMTRSLGLPRRRKREDREGRCIPAKRRGRGPHHPVFQRMEGDDGKPPPSFNSRFRGEARSRLAISSLTAILSA